MGTLQRRPITLALIAAAFSLGVLFAFYSALQHYQLPFKLRPTNPKRSLSFSYSTNRKLLDHEEETNRVGETCSKDDIVVYQGPTNPLPNGIPTYTVEILNVCISGCAISRIHLRCGWFSSARMINPKIFKRLRYDDCLVNDGKMLVNGGSISFQYANSFLYPLSVSSFSCH